MVAIDTTFGANTAPRMPKGAHQAASLTLSARSLGNFMLGLAVFLMGFVFFEPAPYELFVIGLMGIWFIAGLKLRLDFIALFVLLLFFCAGGFISSLQKDSIFDGVHYVSITLFLALTSVFYAALIAERPQERLTIIVRMYTIAAVIGAGIGTTAYLGVMPKGELFLKYGRAAGPFQDPNVFGPYLLFPFTYALHRALSRGRLPNVMQTLTIAVLFAGIFFSFSRATWGTSMLCSLLVAAALIVNNPSSAFRARFVLLLMGAVVAAIVALVVALQFDSIAAMFSERAKLVQEYDGARLGRFARYGIALQIIMENPFGIGPREFNKLFVEDPHNVYIKAFLAYGWLGGFSYLGLVLATLYYGFKNFFVFRPWTPVLQAAFIVFVAHVLMAIIIDVDRWRHLYMLYGILWGMYAVEFARARRERKERTAPARAGRFAQNRSKQLQRG